MVDIDQKTLGFIINPVAGLGGRVGLKGSDGVTIQQRARELGAVPEVFDRAANALRSLKISAGDLGKLITCPGEMGEETALDCGFSPAITGGPRQGKSTAENTREAAQEMFKQGVDLILFAGGDGTARDIFKAVGDTVPAIGIPAGVKMHSAVFGVNPASAGKIAAQFLTGEIQTLRNSEVMDLDEDTYREGNVSPSLYGYLRVPYLRRLVQSRKSPSPVSEKAVLQAISLEIIDHMDEGYYIIGPGTTTQTILSTLGLKKTLIGVDVIQDRKLVINDANEKSLLELLKGNTAKIVVSPIGGQGFIFGRGNQQISPKVLRKIGVDNIIVISAPEKILSLGGRPLLVDTGDYEMDKALSRYIKVISGYGESIIYSVEGGQRI